MLIKRFIDIWGSVAGIIIVCPILIFLYCIIGLKLGLPVIFKQKRPGLNEHMFTFYKFRTMTDERNKKGELMADKDRITPLGNFLRKTSLDELPSLFNVLSGDMSLVGPRPLLVEYLELYSPEQARRHDVKPGITGWAQVNGRNAISWDEKFKLDLWYVQNNSFLIDLKIIFKTIIKVFKQEGISERGKATVTYFKGNTK